MVLRKRSSRVTIGGSTFSGRGGGDGSRSLATGGGFDNGGGGGRMTGVLRGSKEGKGKKEERDIYSFGTRGGRRE